MHHTNQPRKRDSKMPLDPAQVAARTAQFAVLRGRNKPQVAVKTEPVSIGGQIDPTHVYTKQRLFSLLGIGEYTWAKWKRQGLKPFRSGKSLAVEGADVIAAMKK